MTEPALTLTTDRLRLRTYQPSDAEALLPIYSRDDVSRFLLGDPWTAEVARTEIGKRISKTGLSGETKALALVIETDDDNDAIAGSRVIGDIAIWLDGTDPTKAEIGWVLDPQRAATASLRRPRSPCSTWLSTTASCGGSSRRWTPGTPPRRGWRSGSG